MEKIPVIMDCDPGVDDALAILMMFAAPHVDVKAITTVAGNLSLEKCTDNALKIADYFNLNTVVANGFGPIKKQFHPAAEWVHGPSGLGGALLPDTKKQIVPEDAVELIREEALRQQGSLQILATGPLSNIARLFRDYPDIKPLISRITVMGGSCGEGNVTPYAEFNFYTDPDAAQFVFQSGVPITMVGLEVCDHTPIFEEQFALLKSMNTRAGNFICSLFHYPPENGKPFPAEGVAVYDALAAAALIDPEICTGDELPIGIETADSVTEGKTLIGVGKKNAYVITKADADRYWDLILKTVQYFEKD